MKGIIGYTDEELVSRFNGCKFSSVFDVNAGIQSLSNFCETHSWYDNEWDTHSRLVDLLAYTANIVVQGHSDGLTAERFCVDSKPRAASMASCVHSLFPLLPLQY